MTLTTYGCKGDNDVEAPIIASGVDLLVPKVSFLFGNAQECLLIVVVLNLVNSEGLIGEPFHTLIGISVAEDLTCSVGAFAAIFRHSIMLRRTLHSETSAAYTPNVICCLESGRLSL